MVVDNIVSSVWQEKSIQILTLLSRLILGVIFIYASIDKIIYPLAFAEAVYNYQVLPYFLINMTAIILPWLELVIGIFLIIGRFREGSVFMVNLLLIIFVVVMIFNLARGLDIHCGCFSTSAKDTDSGSMAWSVIRDGLFLLPAFYLFYRTFRGKKRPARFKIHEQ